MAGGPPLGVGAEEPRPRRCVRRVAGHQVQPLAGQQRLVIPRVPLQNGDLPVKAVFLHRPPGLARRLLLELHPQDALRPGPLPPHQGDGPAAGAQVRAALPGRGRENQASSRVSVVKPCSLVTSTRQVSESRSQRSCPMSFPPSQNESPKERLLPFRLCGLLWYRPVPGPASWRQTMVQSACPLFPGKRAAPCGGCLLPDMLLSPPGERQQGTRWRKNRNRCRYRHR